MKFLKVLFLAVFLLPVSAIATDSTGVKDYKAAAKGEADSYDDYVKGIKDFEKSPKFKPEILTQEMPYDMDLGKPSAPIKIVEYASLGCIHCKEFHQKVFYDLKKNYIDTGKVYFKFRNYPLNIQALKAALIKECVKPDDRLAFTATLFESQAEWAYSKSEADFKDKLRTVGKIIGLDEDSFEKCYTNQQAEAAILDGMKQASDKLNVNSTPGIFINGHRFLDSRSYEGTAKYIDDILAGKKPEDAGLKDKDAASATTPAATPAATTEATPADATATPAEKAPAKAKSSKKAKNDGK